VDAAVALARRVGVSPQAAEQVAEEDAVRRP